MKAEIRRPTLGLQATINIFSDGSQSQQGTGAAAVVENIPPIFCSLETPSTVFDADLTAIILAAEHIRTQPSGNSIIASHSMLVLAALQNHK